MKDGGPAFPSGKNSLDAAGPNGGMSLRDYFASTETTWPPTSWVQAKVGNHINSILELHGVELAECLAKWRFQMADAMLAEREK